MHLHNLRFLGFVVPFFLGAGGWVASASANPVGVDYYASPYIYAAPQTYRQPSASVSNSVLINPTVINSSIRDSTLINPTIVNPSYYPTVPYYPSYYPNSIPPIFSVYTYTRPSPEVVVDPQYGVRFKNPPGY